MPPASVGGCCFDSVFRCHTSADSVATPPWPEVFDCRRVDSCRLRAAADANSHSLLGPNIGIRKSVMLRQGQVTNSIQVTAKNEENHSTNQLRNRIVNSQVRCSLRQSGLVRRRGGGGGGARLLSSPDAVGAVAYDVPRRHAGRRQNRLPTAHRPHEARQGQCRRRNRLE